MTVFYEREKSLHTLNRKSMHIPNDRHCASRSHQRVSPKRIDTLESTILLLQRKFWQFDASPAEVHPREAQVKLQYVS